MKRSSRKHTYGFTPIKSGFTLVELIIVIAITGILFAIGITRLNPGMQLNRANDARRKADLAKVQTALELYRADHTNYPVSSSMTSSPTTSMASLTTGDPKYMQVAPKDPVTNSWTGYITYLATPLAPSACDNVSIPCTGYVMYVCLQNISDPVLNGVTDNQVGADLCPATGQISYSVTNQ